MSSHHNGIEVQAQNICLVTPIVYCVHITCPSVKPDECHEKNNDEYTTNPYR